MEPAAIRTMAETTTVVRGVTARAVAYFHGKVQATAGPVQALFCRSKSMNALPTQLVSFGRLLPCVRCGNHSGGGKSCSSDCGRCTGATECNNSAKGCMWMMNVCTAKGGNGSRGDSDWRRYLSGDGDDGGDDGERRDGARRIRSTALRLHIPRSIPPLIGPNGGCCWHVVRLCVLWTA